MAQLSGQSAEEFNFAQSAEYPNGYPTGLLIVFWMFFTLQTVVFASAVLGLIFGIFDDHCFRQNCPVPFYKQLLEEPENIGGDQSERDTTKQD
uniref:Uncharacterized protein n=1 Tax=Panagrolaimus sp. JU765 TaxID=591449 RepID=A0AC34RLQ7_9BILA